MKTLLSILFILSLSAIAYQRYAVIPDLKDTAAAAVKDLAAKQADLDSANRDAAQLREKIAALESELALANAPEPDTTPVPEPTPSASPTPSTFPPSGMPEQRLAVRLNDLKRQYDEKKAALDQRKALLDRNEADARAQREAIAKAKPTFKEQRTQADGSKAGIRTSDATRDRALAEHQARLAQVDAYLANTAKARLQLDADYQTLEQNYQAAVTAAREEAGK